MKATFVVVGGGIAGVSCAETLAFYTPSEPIILISESAIVKTVINLRAITQTLADFNIKEVHMDTIMEKYPNVKVVHDKLKELRVESNKIVTNDGREVEYSYLCLCMGAQPKLIPQAEGNPLILGIRDTDSVENLIEKLSSSKQVAIIGNGGIASELIYKIENTKVHWVIKDTHISATFIDPGAAEFLKDRINSKKKEEPGLSHRMRYETDSTVRKTGAALGPDWYKHLNIKGNLTVPEDVTIHYNTEVVEVNNLSQGEHSLSIKLSNSELITCDFIVSATGVQATNFHSTQPLNKTDDNFILVNEFMQSNIPNIYVAGDLCAPNWEHASQWFPMKLWTQARQMGTYAAKAMASSFLNEEIYQDFCFELFTHSTKLFGYKVVLLGLYNGQKLGNDYEVLLRVTPNEEYIKLVMKDGRLQGAVLIGDTDLEETFENLILNGIDLTDFREDLLNPDVDIEDYFD